MQKYLSLWAAFIFTSVSCFSQVNLENDTIPSSKIDWDNYSTSFAGKDNSLGPILPILVTAIPYNGILSNFDEINAPLDMSFGGSSYRFQSNLSDNSRKLYTYDSADVYFLAVGIYPDNTAEYEYEILLNGKNVIVPWKTIDKFTNFKLNDFKKGFGFLGGYKTKWDNFIKVELRKKATGKILSSTVVYWKQIKPVIASIFLSKDLNNFLKILKRPWDKSIKYDTFPANLSLQPNESNIIFYLSADIYKKEALEYSLIKNEDVLSDWKKNDFDNNFIWLQNLSYGNYTLKMRFTKQRHNVTSYQFQIKPFWYQTIIFKIVSGIVIAGIVCLIILLFRFSNQKKRLVAERQKKEKTETDLNAIRAQLNPHFVFNSLSSIQGLINKNEISNANKYLSDFANLMRDTLNRSNKNQNSLSDEIKILENYLQLEQLRFHFSYTIEIDKSLNSSEIEIPTLFLQPLVENAVKHGVSALQKEGAIKIFFTRKSKNLLASIVDNGKGFDSNNSVDGYGLKLTKERIALINGLSKTQSIHMSIQSVERTEVLLTFQNWLG